MDLGFLRALYENPPDGAQAGWPGSGYVSVYLDITPNENAPKEVALRWRSAREELAAAGADEETLDATGRAVTERAHARGRAVFARGGAVRLNAIVPRPAAQGELSSYAPLPNVVPWLARRPPRLPHVRVSASRVGGRVLAVSGSRIGTADGTQAAETQTVGLTEVAGETWPVHKVSVGGWAEWRLQNTTEETWAENAKRIASAAATAAGRVKAEFLVAGGDVRERSMVIDLLPKALRDTVVIVDREVDLGAPAFDEAAWAEAARRADAESRARLDEFHVRMDAPPRDRRAAGGLGDTLTALRDGLVSDVLLADDPASSQTAWIGPGLADAATEKEQLAGPGAAEPVRVRADAALARAAAGTGAELHFFRREPGEAGFVAALLRAPSAALG